MRCGMCEALHFEVEDEKDLQNTHAEIVALNNWKPGRIRKIRKGDGVKKPGTISKGLLIFWPKQNVKKLYIQMKR